METPASPAEELPALYRTILDGVAALEVRGERREAALVRSAAIAAYSASWDARGRRRLISLIRRIDRVVAGEERARIRRPRPWLPARRSAVAR